ATAWRSSRCARGATTSAARSWRRASPARQGRTPGNTPRPRRSRCSCARWGARPCSGRRSTDASGTTVGRRIAVLAGGVGAARFLRGLARHTEPRDLTIIGNTADDEEFFGLHVSPDLDTVLYTLAGRAEPRRGWGLRGDTFACLRALGRLGAPTWFALGDRDLATHLVRTAWLRAGRPLSAVTAHLARRLGVRARLLPMTDDRVRTFVHAGGRRLPFQDYLVRRRPRGGDRHRAVEPARLDRAHAGDPAAAARARAAAGTRRGDLAARRRPSPQGPARPDAAWPRPRGLAPRDRAPLPRARRHLRPRPHGHGLGAARRGARPAGRARRYRDGDSRACCAPCGRRAAGARRGPRVTVAVIPLPGLPMSRPGDDLGRLLGDAIEAARVGLKAGDAVAVCQKVVSKAEGAVVDLAQVTPSPLAEELARQTQAKDARAIEVVLRETRRIVRHDRGHLIVETRHGWVCANAGVDESNGLGPGTVTLLPRDADASAAALRAVLGARFGVEVAVVAGLVMGKASGIAAAIVRGVGYRPGPGGAAGDRASARAGSVPLAARG